MVKFMLWMSMPRPCLAPTNSPTMAPMRAKLMRTACAKREARGGAEYKAKHGRHEGVIEVLNVDTARDAPPQRFRHLGGRGQDELRDLEDAHPHFPHAHEGDEEGHGQGDVA